MLHLLIDHSLLCDVDISTTTTQPACCERVSVFKLLEHFAWALAVNTVKVDSRKADPALAL